MQHRPTYADGQLAVFDSNMHVAELEAEQPQEALKIRRQVFTKARIEQEPQLVFAHLQADQIFELFADGRNQMSQVFPGAHDELVLDLDVRQLVQHCLHHRELVEVVVQQAVDDSWLLDVCAFHDAFTPEWPRSTPVDR